MMMWNGWRVEVVRPSLADLEREARDLELHRLTFGGLGRLPPTRPPIEVVIEARDSPLLRLIVAVLPCAR